MRSDDIDCWLDGDTFDGDVPLLEIDKKALFVAFFDCSPILPVSSVPPKLIKPVFCETGLVGCEGVEVAA